MNRSNVLNIEEMEDIAWDGESNSDNDDASTEINEKLLAPEELIVLGSRFEGITLSDIPMWLRELVSRDSVININGILHLYTGVEGAWYPLRSIVSLKVLSSGLNLYAPVNFACAVEPYVVMIEAVPWPIVILNSTFTQGRLRYGFSLDEGSMVVKFHPSVYIGIEATPKSTLCSMPVSNISPVLQMKLRFSSARAHRDNAIGWLHRVFGSNVNTILWAIGDMLI